ncbi:MULTISPECIES: flagellar motor protein MotB [Bacillaceae]|uniref:flagellar motor protein MotB n=1 Tax=Bacillaceae TaxID=186817 RepID=UPI0006F9CE37|nr:MULTISPECIES: flagellar motor protein MotB [Bacillaceae]KQL32459.1 flagellar motor protein MotB [Psychrobacillus sp. FJAT-21963]MDF2068398.1 flagellar motor protein MotB [Bacillus sp. Cr_A10]
MAKKHKKHKEEEEMSESWLLPYADILTLLLALFIVLFASSTVDQEKLEQMSQVFSQVFDGGVGLMENPSPLDVPVTPNKTNGNEQSSAYIEDQQALSEIQDSVDEYIAVNALEKQFATQLTDEGLLVTIRDSILFDTGEAEVNPQYRQIAEDISDLLVFDPPRHVVITGHTDNVPISSSEFSSNWELSVMRSVNFLKILVNNNTIDPLYFSAKGYGEFKPVAKNDTAEGRAKNRRVEVLIQPRVLEDGTLNDEPK